MAEAVPLRSLTPEQAKAAKAELERKAKAEGRKQGYAEGLEAGRAEGAHLTAAAVAASATEMRAQQADTMKHARQAAWARGGIIGLLVGTAFGATVVNIFLGAAFDQATRMSRETTITGALIQQQNAPDRCLPGEHLSDGRVCPQR